MKQDSSAHQSRQRYDSVDLNYKVQQAILAKDLNLLHDLLGKSPAPTIAEVLRLLPSDQQVLVFRMLPRAVAVSAFEYLRSREQESLLMALGHEDVSSVLNSMAPDDRTTLFEELPATLTKRLMSLLGDKERSLALSLLGYPAQSVGRLMTPQYIAVQEGETVQQVLDYIREHGQNSETLNVIYVTDSNGILIDDLKIRELLLVPVNKRIADLMDYRYVCLSATDNQRKALELFKNEDRKALPVVDKSGSLIGIVTIDDILDVAETAATRDIQQVGGTESLEGPYMQVAIHEMVKKRGGWLVVLFLGEMLTATAMGFFEGEIEKAVVLALFVPLIISSGGNSGSQATTLIIRALALGEVTLKDWFKVLRREIFTGLALGVLLGIIGFLRISVWSLFSTIYGPHWLLVALTVGFSLVGIVMWGSIAGSMLPFILRRFGFDPATASAPFVATLVDVTGLIIYFTVGMLFLRGTLL